MHLPLALLHHQVGEHEARLLVARLVPHERGALRLRLLELAAGNVEPRHRQQRLLVRLLLLERLLHNQGGGGAEIGGRQWVYEYHVSEISRQLVILIRRAKEGRACLDIRARVGVGVGEREGGWQGGGRRTW